MMIVTVGRLLTQRRSPNEVKENVEYLANLPRKIGFALHSIEIEEPAERGLLWYYRGIIRYIEKEHQKPGRLEKDRNIVLERIGRAGAHKCWGRALWKIEGEPSRNGLSVGKILEVNSAIPERDR